MEITDSKIEYQPPLQGDVYYQRQVPSNSAYCDIKARLEEIINNIISPKKEPDFNTQLNEKFLELDFGAEFDVNAELIGIDDAIFFVNLLNQEQVINYSVSNEGKIELNCLEKEIPATSSLLNMLSSSIETKKPIRLDFDNDVTVILRLDREGKVQAHFIPGTSQVENYLKNNITSLKQAFDDENINYSYLGYSKNGQENEKKKKRSNK